MPFDLPRFVPWDADCVGEPGSYQYARSCPYKIYIDSWKLHWSLQSYMVHNDRFRQVWNFPRDLSPVHIEQLHEVGFLVKGHDPHLPIVRGYMSPQDFQVCKGTPETITGRQVADGQWRADQYWGERSTAGSWLVGALLRGGMMLSYATNISYDNDDSQLLKFVAVLVGIWLCVLAAMAWALYTTLRYCMCMVAPVDERQSVPLKGVTTHPIDVPQ